MRFGTWNVRSLCRIGSLKTVARELGKYKLELVSLQVRWGRETLNGQTVIHFSVAKGMGIIS
jgi:hypothetical protein